MSRDKKKMEQLDRELEAQAPAAPAPPPAAGYGIQQAMELMRGLPADLQTAGVVVQVIKRTLESAHVSVASIVADGTRRVEQITGRIGVLQEEIAAHQREIETRVAETGRLQAELDAVSGVIERLSP